MATITVRNVSDALLARIKLAAERNGRSMEQEVRDLLQERYMTRDEVLARIRARWKGLPAVPAGEVAAWREAGRA